MLFDGVVGDVFWFDFDDCWIDGLLFGEVYYVVGEGC